jgi:hypothetical protein
VEAIENGAKRYGSKVTVQYGKAEFVDDTSGQGTDREQRDRAREIYEANVRESPVARSAEIWAGVRDRWGKTSKAAAEKRLIRVSRSYIASLCDQPWHSRRDHFVFVDRNRLLELVAATGNMAGLPGGKNNAGRSANLHR